MGLYDKWRNHLVVLSVAFLNALVIIRLTNSDLFSTISYITCYYTTNHITGIATVIAFCTLLQFFHANDLVYMFKNIGVLSIRFSSSEKTLWKIQQRVFLRNIIFICLVIFGAMIAGCTLRIPFESIFKIDIMLVLIRAIWLCTILSCVQVIGMIYFNETQTYLLGVGTSLLYQIMSSIIPASCMDIKQKLGCWLVIYIITLSVSLVFQKKQYIGKWGQYAN